MTLPGGMPITLDAVDNRQVVPNQSYTGEIEYDGWGKRHGYIKMAPGAALPPHVTAKLQEMNKEAQEKGRSFTDGLIYFNKDDLEKGFWPKKEDKVTFKVYTDNRGA